MLKLLTVKEILKDVIRKKRYFVFCIFASVIKAIFYGCIFAYEIKHIMYAINENNLRILNSSIFQLMFCIVIVAVMNTFYTRRKTRIMNQMISEYEDEIITKYNTCYSLQDTNHKLIILQNTVPNVMNQSIEYIFSVVYLMSVLTISVIYGLTMSVPIVVIGICISCILAFATKKLSMDVTQRSKESEDAINDVYGKIWEYNDNLEILAFLDKKETYAHLDDAIHKENQIKIHADKLTNMSRIFMRFSNIGTVLVGGLVGGLLVYLHHITIADLMALIILLPIISDSMFQIPAKLNEYQIIDGMCKVTNDFFIESDHWMKTEKDIIVNQISNISFSAFRYTIDNNKEIFIDDFIMKTGNIYGIYGESGVGKTTFLRILTKLIDSYQGSIMADDTNLHTINCKHWWNKLSYLEQEGVIIPGTLYDNICLQSDKEINEISLKEAISLAELNEFVSERKNLDANISSDNISSGEKQQICLARAFYMRHNIILLDEATSALSPKRENSIMKNLNAWVKMNQCIAIVITHNRTLLEYFDEMIQF